MTRVVFLRRDKKLLGFRISGHCTADCNDEIGKLCCAAVSSAAYMAANTITDIVNAPADASDKDGFMELILKDTQSEECQTVLKGLKLHLTEFSKDCNGFLTIKTEVI